MDLSIAASFFDDTPVLDSAGALLFTGQLDLYDDSKRDGVGVDRRILSMDPTLRTLLPADGVVQLNNEHWIVGDGQSDSFQGTMIRHKRILQRADAQVSYGTVAAYLGAAATSQAWVGIVWTKEAKYDSVTDRPRTFYTLYLPAGFTDLAQGDLVQYAGKPFRVRSRYATAGGFLAVEILELTAELVTASFTTRSFDGVMGGFTASASSDVAVLAIEFYEDYKLDHPALTLEPGDKHAYVLKSAVPAVATGNTVTLDRAYTVRGVASEGACWSLRLSP